MNSFGSASTGARTVLRGRARAASLVVGLLAIAALLGACSDDAAEPPFTQPPVPEGQDWLFDVVGTAANNVYACGAKGAMFRWDGAAWTAVDLGVSDPIVRMWKEDGGSTLYAVGHKGRIWRNTGSGWTAMASGTSQNLYGIGALGGVVHAVGQDGTICRLSGSSWSVTGGRMFQLNEVGVPVDTLLVAEDLASLVTVNNYFLGGAYIDPNYVGTRIGVLGTRGMVLAPNTDPTFVGEWILRPLSGEQTVPHEWVLSTTSDPAILSRNYLGTSEGWLFRLTRDDDGKNVWAKFYPSLTSNPGAGINDIWVDASDNVYIVTDEGQLVFQTADYDFAAETGRRVVLFDGLDRLTGVWGSGPDDIWIVGYREETILHAAHDQGTDDCVVTPTAVAFPGKAARMPDGVDHLGRPLD